MTISSETSDQLRYVLLTGSRNNGQRNACLQSSSVDINGIPEFVNLRTAFVDQVDTNHEEQLMSELPRNPQSWDVLWKRELLRGRTKQRKHRFFQKTLSKSSGGNFVDAQEKDNLLGKYYARGSGDTQTYNALQLNATVLVCSR